MPSITVTFAPHRINGWFLKAAAWPVVCVDGRVSQGSWGSPVQVEASETDHEVSAGVRYRFAKGDLLGPPITARPGAHLTASNGPFNGEPFRLRP